MADGDGPKEVNGYSLVRDFDRRCPESAARWQFDGNVELLETQ
ncbi:hypothetical protein ACRAWF_08015 [Streptomyces sp. L7]